MVVGDGGNGEAAEKWVYHLIVVSRVNADLATCVQGRKLILSVALAVLFQGTPPQLGGSLLTTFLFLLAHILLKPYINQGLNEFQVIMTLQMILSPRKLGSQ